MAGFDFGTFEDVFGYNIFGGDIQEEKKSKKEKKAKKEIVETTETIKAAELEPEVVDEELTEGTEEGIEEGIDKKEEKKSSSGTKKSAPKKKKDVGDTKLTCPVEIYLPAHKFTLDAAGGSFTPTLKVILNELSERYPETQVLTPVVDGNKVYFVLKNVQEVKLNHLYDITDGNCVQLAWGEKQGEYTDATFDGKPSVELSEVADFIASTDDSYRNITYLGKDNIIIPFFKECNSKRNTKSLYEECYTFVIFGKEYPLCSEETVYDTLQFIVKDKLPKLTEKQEVMYRIDTVAKKVYVFLKCMDAESIGVDTTNKPEKKKEVTKSYPLPLNVWLYTFGDEIVLSPEDFGGAKFVTLNQIKKHFAKTIDAFADSERKVDAVYNKVANKLSIGFVSGKKG